MLTKVNSTQVVLRILHPQSLERPALHCVGFLTALHCAMCMLVFLAFGALRSLVAHTTAASLPCRFVRVRRRRRRTGEPKLHFLPDSLPVWLAGRPPRSRCTCECGTQHEKLAASTKNAAAILNWHAGVAEVREEALAAEIQVIVLCA